MSLSARQLGHVAAWMLLGSGLASCDALLDIPDRQHAARLTCDDHGACACEAGFADCDGEPSNGCEVTLATDAKHCGVCGHDCLGGACSGSACQPVELAAFGNDATRGIRTDGKNVYWVTCSDIPLHVVGVDGGEVRSYGTTAEGCRPLVLTGGLAVLREGQLYWACGSTVYHASTDALATHTPVLTEATIDSFAVSQDYYYVLNSISATADRFPIAGGAKVTLDSGFFTGNVVVNSTHAFWGGEQGIEMVAHGSIQLTRPIHEPTPWVNVDEADMVWLHETKTTSNQVRVTPIDGGSSVTLGPARSGCGIETDGKNVYWQDSDFGQIRRAPRDGSAPSVPLAIDQQLSECPGLALDDVAVYWASGGKVWKVAK